MTGKGRQQWQHLLSVIEDFAEQHGCDQMELIARPGWARILKQYKYKRTHVVLEATDVLKATVSTNDNVNIGISYLTIS